MAAVPQEVKLARHAGDLDDDGHDTVAAGAPTTADYLVGTAQGGLSAEIVVGTTPGGELGGTWASPTVDATHSGSTHSAATDTHIADTSAAHVASSIGFTPNGSIAATDVQAAIQEVRDEAGAGTLHEVVMVTSSSPPDPVLNSAGDDWCYSSS